MFKNSPIDNDCLTMAVIFKEVKAALQSTKSNKAAGTDGMYPEMLKNLGSKAFKWITQVLNNIMDTGKLLFNRATAKVISILKPGKEAKHPSIDQ